MTWTLRDRNRLLRASLEDEIRLSVFGGKRPVDRSVGGGVVKKRSRNLYALLNHARL